jgi:adenylate kinase
VKNRLSVYHEQTQPLIDFYTERKVLKTVDGTKSTEEVFDSIVKILEA